MLHVLHTHTKTTSPPQDPQSYHKPAANPKSNPTPGKLPALHADPPLRDPAGALSLNGPLPLPLLQLLLALLLEELLLALGVHEPELLVALLLLQALLLRLALLGLLELLGALELADRALTRFAEGRQDLRPEVRVLDQEVGQADEVREEGEDVGIVVVGGEAVAEVDALLGLGLIDAGRGLECVADGCMEGRRGVLPHRLVDGLVGDDQVLKVIARLRDGVNQLGSEEGVRNLGALRHDRHPRGQLRVVLGRGKRDIVPVIAEALHLLLVHHSPDEPVVGRLGHLDLGAGNRRHNLGLPPVERVNRRARGIPRRLDGVKEGPEHGLECAHDGVKPLRQPNVDINERSVHATRGIRLELEQALLLDDARAVVGLGVGARRHAVEAHGAELGAQERGVGARPRARLVLVAPRPDEVEDDQHGDNSEDVALDAELAERVPLVHVVPLREGLAGGGLGRRVGERGAAGGRRGVGERRGVSELGEVCDAMAGLAVCRDGCLFAGRVRDCDFELPQLGRMRTRTRISLGSRVLGDFPRILSRKLAMVNGDPRGADGKRL